MTRKILDIDGLMDHLPFTKNQIYKAVHHRENPLPYKKLGRRLLFDLEKVLTWYDGPPGTDHSMGDDL